MSVDLVPARLRALDAELGAVPGVVSVWCGRLDAATAAYEREADRTHYAASTMKVAVLAALYRADEAGTLDLDAPIPVRNGFASAAPGAPTYANEHSYDNDDAVWDRLGGEASPRWLASRMIVRSSNLATNLVLAAVGLPAVAEVWSLVGARHSHVDRGIEDSAAAEAGITNEVTAADLARLLTAIARGDVAGSGAMLDTLLAQECTEDLAAGLPPGTRVAHKNGWIPGVRHGAGVVFPDDAPPYAVVVCTSTPWARNDADDEACRLVARIAAASWQDRHAL